jgi:hypothetical protein
MSKPSDRRKCSILNSVSSTVRAAKSCSPKVRWPRPLPADWGRYRPMRSVAITRRQKGLSDAPQVRDRWQRGISSRYRSSGRCRVRTLRGDEAISRTPRQVFSTGSNIRPSRMSASPGEASGAGPDPVLQDSPRQHRPNSDMVPTRVTRRTIPDCRCARVRPLVRGIARNMRRREFITILGSTTAWPLAVRVQ